MIMGCMYIRLMVSRRGLWGVMLVMGGWSWRVGEGRGMDKGAGSWEDAKGLLEHGG